MVNIPVPQRPMSASEIIVEFGSLRRDERDAGFVSALLAGHVPTHMRTMVDVDVSFMDKDGNKHQLVISTFPDYLTVGTDHDYLRVPLSPLDAQQVADAWACVLPTTKVVTSLWKAAHFKLPPEPWGPPYDASMMSTQRIVDHNSRIEATARKHNVDPSKLVAGHKKDVVVTNKLVKQPEQVAIFGWHKLDGVNIQPLYLGHENTYADYSHGIRLISRDCKFDGVDDDIIRLMNDPIACDGLSDEGPAFIFRQPPKK